MTHLRNKKDGGVGADRVRTGLDKTELRGRQEPYHSDLTVSFSEALGSRRCHHLAVLPHSAQQRPGAEVQGKMRVALVDVGDVHRYDRCSGGFDGSMGVLGRKNCQKY